MASFQSGHNEGFQFGYNYGTVNAVIHNNVPPATPHRKEDETQTIRSWLNAPNPEIKQNIFNQKHHKGIGEWFLNSDSFRNWLSTSDSFLWVHGVPGCGKSVMFSAAVENIRQLHANAGFAFFYFNFNDRSQQNASGMLRSLILQLLPKVHDDDCVKTLYRKWHSLGIEASETPLDKLIDCLGCLARQFADIYILIDALDECPQNEERESVLDSIATMRQWSLPALHVLVSSHDITDIRQSFNPQPGQAVNMRNPGVERDISNYVFHELTTRINLSHWKNDYLQIQALLNERAQGV
jgi:hypothetical protein